MSRLLVYTFVGAMLLTVIGQAVKLRAHHRESVIEITLEQSRLIPFLAHIRDWSPHTYESILLNLSRIESAGRESKHYQFEEVIVAEKLMEHLIHLNRESPINTFETSSKSGP